MHTMSRTFLSVLLVVAAACGLATASGTPHLISYQGRATNSLGNPVSDGNHNVWLFLYTSSSGASYVWSDNATIATKDGLFSYTLGSDPTAPLADSLFTKYDSLFLGVNFDGQMLTPLTPLASAPYAMRVNTLSGSQGGSILGPVSVYNSDASQWAGAIQPDVSSGGGGYVAIGRKPSTTGFAVDGNYIGSLQPMVSILGDSRSAVFSMADSLSNSVVLPTSAIEANEIVDEPGLGSCVNTTVGLTSSIVNICGRTMFAPANGYVLVTGVANLYASHTQGTTTQVSFGVSDNISSYVTSTQITIVIPSQAPTGAYYYPMVSHGLFPINKGSHAYYFLASGFGGSPVQAFNITFTELFVPTAYTTISAPVAPDGGELQPALLDPAAEFVEADAWHRARLQKEASRLAAEVAKLQRDLETEAEKQNVTREVKRDQ